MAKVDEIVLNIDGKEIKYNINVGKKGIFKVHLDSDIAEKLGMKGNLEYSKLNDLKLYVSNHYTAYLNATKIEEIFIGIRFVASGKYSTGIIKDEKFKKRGWAGDTDMIGFEFDIYIKETASTGTVVWYDACKGDPNSIISSRKKEDPNKYYKNGQNSREPQGVLIPYSDQALETLEKGREGLKKISAVLYNFISQEPEAIVQQLTKGVLLQNNTQ